MTKKLDMKAVQFCLENQHRFTKPRQKVLSTIVKSKKPIKAYEILEKLKKPLSNPKPPTIYRAIEFWVKHNFIHRIESLNAYTACVENHLHKGSQFLICIDCGKVIESHLCELPKMIKETTLKNSFKPDSWNLEVNGRCIQCS